MRGAVVLGLSPPVFAGVERRIPIIRKARDAEIAEQEHFYERN
ncbi:MAG TPA: hypothetical protein VK579_16625 [Terriglobales bacterium]|nr:hypothetical protein [Terriglobales bacterium]